MSAGTWTWVVCKEQPVLLTLELLLSLDKNIFKK